ncbi:phage baseplate assembly protein [Thalassospira sp. MCCC 1A01428]|uniref:phage baseplate assembly protein domain-containing protein n=1 Tax=Thalassospira sp. MCCC 1A01428 TaxID=1470575 RepID=UPI00143DEBD4|nr:phage baseplate assembly protein [Thalassospira sp. MCCC 1A01428]
MMLEYLLERLTRRVENMLFRAVVRYVRLSEQGGARVAQVAGRAGETPDDVTVMLPYGFDHIPHPVDASGRGAEMIALMVERNLVVALPAMDRRHRAQSGASENGEISLYDDQGQRITLKRGRKALIETDILHIVAANKVIITAPLAEFSGNVTIGGNLTVAGDITDQTGAGNARSMAGMRETYNGHDHAENDNGGPTGTPNQEM